jgi:hypothetical protein
MCIIKYAILIFNCHSPLFFAFIRNNEKIILQNLKNIKNADSIFPLH